MAGNEGIKPRPEYQIEIDSHTFTIENPTFTRMYEHKVSVAGGAGLDTEIEKFESEEDFIKRYRLVLYGFRKFTKVEGTLTIGSGNELGKTAITVKVGENGITYLDGVIETREEVEQDVDGRLKNDRKLLLEMMDREGVDRIIHLQRQPTLKPDFRTRPFRLEDRILITGHTMPVEDLTEKNEVRESMFLARERNLGF